MTRVEPHVGVPGLDHPSGDRLRDDVAGGEVRQLVDALHEAATVPVDEERTLAPHRLGDQRLLAAGVRAEPHHGRVELHELQVTQYGAGSVGHRHPVAGRDRRVGGLGEHLTESAAGQDDGPAPDGADAVTLALAHHVEGDPGDATIVGEQQVDSEGVLDDLDLGRARHGGDQGPLDLGARGVAAGVGDPVAVVAALAGEAELAVRVQVEVRAERDQLPHRLGALGDQDPDRLGVARPRACDQGVLLVLRRGVTGSEGGRDPALGPLRRAGVEHVLGHHQHLADAAAQPERGGQASDAGADHHDVGRDRPAGVGRRETADHTTFAHDRRLLSRTGRA